jgi:type II secretory pathway pseudopilin PulG
MSNLIVTIISIALAAAVAASAVYYGGTAYLDNEAKAAATQIVSYQANYVQALDVWAQRNGGFPMPSANFPTTPSIGNVSFIKSEIDNFLVPRYMQSNSAPGNLIISPTIFLYFDAAIMQNSVLATFLGPTGQKICGAIETLRTGTTPSYRTFSYNNLLANKALVNPMFCGDVGCFINNGDWGNAATYKYVVYSRVGGRPNVNNPDVNPTTCN